MESKLLEMAVSNSTFAIIIIIGILMLKQIFRLNKEEINRNSNEMIRLTDKMNQVIIAINKLEIQIETLNKIISRTEKNEKDIHAMFTMFRELKRDQ